MTATTTDTAFTIGQRVRVIGAYQGSSDENTGGTTCFARDTEVEITSIHDPRNGRTQRYAQVSGMRASSTSGYPTSQSIDLRYLAPLVPDRIARGVAVRVDAVGSSSFTRGQTVYAVRPEGDAPNARSWLFSAAPVPADAPVDQWNAQYLRDGRPECWWLTTSNVTILGPAPTAAPAAAPTRPARGVAVRIINSSAPFPVGAVVHLLHQEVGSWLASERPVPASVDISDWRAAGGGGGEDISGTRWWISPRQFEIVTDAAAAPRADETEAQRLTRERDEAVAALATFRKAVRRVATDEATKRGWCSEIDTVLAKIDPTLTRVEQKTRVTRTLTVEIEVDGSFDGESCMARPSAVPVIDPTSLLDECFGSGSSRVRLVSSRWNGRDEAVITKVDTEDEPVTTGGTRAPLTARHPFRTGESYFVLPGARRLNSTDDNVPTPGTIVTVAQDGTDYDGDVVLTYNNQTIYALPQYLAIP